MKNNAVFTTIGANTIAFTLAFGILSIAGRVSTYYSFKQYSTGSFIDASPGQVFPWLEIGFILGGMVICVAIGLILLQHARKS